MEYKVENLLDENDIQELIKLYNSLPSSLAHQDYNLFNVDKRPIGSLERGKVKAFEKLDSYAKLKRHGCYFVMYEGNSFTKVHTDNDDAIGLTTVTLLDEVNLIGGETLVMLSYQDEGRPENKYRKGDMVNAKCIPHIVDCKVGQTMVYGPSLLHGVCQLKQGKRLVLVQWYNK